MTPQTEHTIDPSEARALEQIMGFLRALRAAARVFRLYPAGHISTIAAADRLWEAFSAISGEEEVDFSVHSDSFRIGDRVAYAGEGPGDEMIQSLYRASVRRVRIHRSAPREEVIRFAAILGSEVPADGMMDDLATMLWEAGLPSVDIEVEDVGMRAAAGAYMAGIHFPGQEGEGYGTGQGTEAARKAGEEAREGGADQEGATASGAMRVNPSDVARIKSVLLAHLSGYESDAAASIDWDRAFSPDAQLAHVLHVLLGQEQDAENLGFGLERGVALIPVLLSDGLVNEAVSLIGDLKRAAERLDEKAGAASGSTLLAGLGSRDCVQSLIEALDAGAGVDSASLAWLLEAMPDASLALLAPAAARHKALRDALASLAPERLRAFYGLLGSEDPAVQEIALELVQGSASEEAVAHLEPAMRSGHESIRLRALDVAARFLTDPRAVGLMVPLLSDPAPAVRQRALGCLAASRAPQALARIRALILDPEFLRLSIFDRSTILTVVGERGGETAVPVLRDLLLRGSLLPNQTLRETQEMALRILGGMRHPAARQALEYAGSAGPRWLRKAATELAARGGPKEGA